MSDEDFVKWLAVGINAGWVEPACSTHDGIPSTDEEDAQWERGEDPCVPILRVWG